MNETLKNYIDQLRSEIGGPSWYRDPIVEELEGHVRESVAELVDGGLSEEEAVAMAIERFGNPSDVAARFAAESPPRAGIVRRLLEAGMLSKLVVAVAALTMLGAGINTYFSLAQHDDPFMVIAMKVFVGVFVIVVGAITVVSRNTEDPRRAGLLLVGGLAMTALGSAGFIFALTMSRATGHFEGPIVLIQMLLGAQGILTAWMVWSRITRLRASGS